MEEDYAFVRLIISPLGQVSAELVILYAALYASRANVDPH